VEYYLSNTLVIRGGYFTNDSNSPGIDATKTNQSDHVDLTVYSLSLSRFSKQSSITFGLNNQSGVGEAQVVSGSTNVQKINQDSTTIFLSNSYKF
jgi:hypothetical protein